MQLQKKNPIGDKSKGIFLLNNHEKLSRESTCEQNSTK